MRFSNRLEPPFLDLHAANWTARDRYEIRADARRFEELGDELRRQNRAGRGHCTTRSVGGWMRSGRGCRSLHGRCANVCTTCRRTLRDLGTQQCGIVTFTVNGRDPQDIRRALAMERINVGIARGIRAAGHGGAAGCRASYARRCTTTTRTTRSSSCARRSHGWREGETRARPDASPSRAETEINA